MREEVFDIIRSAVTIAKDRQIRSVKVLRRQLLELHPGREAEISEALAFWGSYVRERADYIPIAPAPAR